MSSSPSQRVEDMATIASKNALAKYREHRARGDDHLAGYFDGQYRAWRAVELMLGGAEYLVACDTASKEINPPAKPKYHLDIEVSRDGEPDEGRWYSWSNIVTEGNSLDECLDNASIGKVDQDGGDFGEGPADASWMQDMIVEAFNLKYGDDHDPTPWCGSCGAFDKNQMQLRPYRRE